MKDGFSIFKDVTGQPLSTRMIEYVTDLPGKCFG